MGTDKEIHNPEDFVQAIQDGQGDFGSFKIEGDLVLENMDISQSLTLYDVEIDGNLSVFKSQFPMGISFYNCSIKGDFIIKGSSIQGGLSIRDLEIDGSSEILDSALGSVPKKKKDSKSLFWTSLKIGAELKIDALKSRNDILVLDAEMSSLEIRNSRFEQSRLEFHRAHIVDEVIVKKLVSKELLFQELKLDGSLSISKSEIQRIAINESRIEAYTEINNIQGDALEISYNRFEGSLMFNAVECEQISLTDNDLGDELILEELMANSLELDDNRVKKIAELSRLSLKSELSIIDCTFKSHLEISGLKSPTLQIEGNASTRETNFSIDDETIGNSHFEGNVNEINILDGTYERGLALDLGKRPLPQLEISLTPSFSGLILLEHGKVKKIVLKGFNKNGNLYFYRTLFGSINFNSFSNEGQVTFSQVRFLKDKKSSLMIFKSSLGNTRFMNMNMRSLDRVNVFDSLLEDIKYSNVSWFHKSQFNIESSKSQPEHKPLYLGQKREVLRQLKYAAEKQGDRIQALSFRADEYSVYGELLDWKIKESETNRWQLRAEKWGIQMGVYTNNLGQNWLKPLAQILVITTVLYPFFVVAASNELTWWPFGNELAITDGLNLLWGKLGAFPQLFNPARYLTRVFEQDHLPAAAYFWDTLHRIVLAFYIYQIISAFRKYFK